MTYTRAQRLARIRAAMSGRRLPYKSRSREKQSVAWEQKQQEFAAYKKATKTMTAAEISREIGKNIRAVNAGRKLYRAAAGACRSTSPLSPRSRRVRRGTFDEIVGKVWDGQVNLTNLLNAPASPLTREERDRIMRLYIAERPGMP